MHKAALEQILITELGYSPFEAAVTADDLLNLQPQLTAAAERWARDRTQTELSVSGFSALELMKRKHFTYPAALIALDWLLTDPEAAARELSQDIRRR